MKKIFITLYIMAGALCAMAEQPKYTPTPEAVQSAQEFRDMRFGIFIHWGIYSMPAQGEWALQTRKYKHEEYKRFAGGFYPSKFDADAWVKAFKAAGAKYITFTSRHHDGFSMFDTKYSDYDIMDASPYKKDIVGALSKACEENGLRFHLYYSLLDWGRDDYYPLGRTGLNTGRTKHGEWKDYIQFMKNQLTELLTNYKNVKCIWFDGLWDRDEQPHGLDAETWDLDGLYGLIHQLKPDCLVGNNHHMDPFQGEDIQIFECDVPGENTAGYSTQGISQLPLETCQTMNDSWGYRISDENFKSADQLIRYLVQTAGRDANLLLNVGPRPDGTIPEASLERLAKMGEWLKTYGETIYGTRGGIVAPHAWGATTQRGNTLYVHYMFPSDKSLFIPYADNKVKAVRWFVDKKPVKYIETADGILIQFTEVPKDVDNVIEITYKNEIKK